MLNYIIPPIIIIIGSAVLIMFLLRKVSAVPEGIIEKGYQKQRTEAMVNTAKINHFFLRILERIMQWSKLLSLKLHNSSNNMFQTIRSKRQEKLEQVQKLHEEANKQQSEVEIVEEEEKETPALIKNNFFARSKSTDMRRVEAPAPKVHPVVSSRVALPESRQQKIEKPMVKDQLEEVLIKRIALNPRDVEAYERLGDYYIESENYRDALECYDQVSRLTPSNTKAKMKIRKLERIVNSK